MGRPKQAQSQLSKQLIYEEAMLLLCESGEAAVTFRKLAGRLDVTAMAVKHHVGSRQQLLQQLVVLGFEGVGKVPDGLDGHAALIFALEGYCKRVIEQPELMRIILSNIQLMPEQLHLLTEQIRTHVNSIAIGSDQADVVVGLIADYTHGFATSVAAFQGDAAQMDGLRIEDYRKGLEWVLSRLA